MLLVKLAPRATMCLALKATKLRSLPLDVDVILIRLVYYFDFIHSNNFQLVNVSVGGVHPCTYVSEGVNVCIVEPGEVASDEDCWTLDKCARSDIRKLELFQRDGHLDHENADNHEHEDDSAASTTASSTNGLVAGMTLLLSFV